MRFVDQPVSLGMIIMGAALILWVAVALVLYWRYLSLTREVSALRDQSLFFDTLLGSDRRYPIWIWTSGRVQASQSALRLLRLSGNVDGLDDLIGDSDGGLPETAVERIRVSLATGGGGLPPLVTRFGQERTPVLIDIQKLNTRSDDWPACVLWIEETAAVGQHGNATGLRMLEERLHDFTRIFDAFPAPVWVRGEDGALIEVNNAYVDAVEGKDSTLVVREGQELFKNSIMAESQRASDREAKVQSQHQAVAGGSVRTFEVSHIPISGGQVLGVAVDISRTAEAERELERVLAAQSETLNLLRTPVAIFGPNQTLRFFNSAFSRLTHISEEILASEISHGELLDSMRAKRRIPEQADYRAWRKAQLRLHTSVVKDPQEELWYLPDGRAHRVISQPHPQSGLLLLFDDITDALALETKYNTLIEVQQASLDNMSEGVAVFSQALTIELSNPAFAAIWQLDSDRIQPGTHVSEMLQSLKPVERSGSIVEDANFKHRLPAWMDGRETREGRWYRADGSVFDYALVPLPDGGVMLTQVDVTDSFRVQQALRERSRALEVADRLKNQFITNMSYELRTPLNSIIGFGELLQQQLFGPLNDVQMGYVSDILGAADELKSMISDVLDLAVIEAGEMTLEVRHVDMVAILNESALLAQELAHKANMLLTLEASDDAKSLMGDPRRLKQAFYNMVSAMLTLGRFGGTLTIALECQGETCRVRVTNLDCGMTANDRDNLLASIEMGGMPTGRRVTGVDLALVKSIIRLHGGNVFMEPIGDEGIALVCELPRTQRPTHLIAGSEVS